jgi:hypothetical protein
VLAVGVLGAIHAAPREQAGDLRDADAEHLLRQDVCCGRTNIDHLRRLNIDQGLLLT